MVTKTKNLRLTCIDPITLVHLLSHPQLNQETHFNTQKL